MTAMMDFHRLQERFSRAARKKRVRNLRTRSLLRISFVRLLTGPRWESVCLRPTTCADDAIWRHRKSTDLRAISVIDGEVSGQLRQGSRFCHPAKSDRSVSVSHRVYRRETGNAGFSSGVPQRPISAGVGESGASGSVSLTSQIAGAGSGLKTPQRTSRPG